MRPSRCEVRSTRTPALRDVPKSWSRSGSGISSRFPVMRGGSSEGRPSEEPPRMSGNLEEIPLPDLLQLFGTSRKAGVLVLRTSHREGRIYLHEGRIRFASIEGAPGVAPLKAIY